MDSIYLGVLEHVLEVLVAHAHTPVITAFLELLGIALTDGIAVRVRMLLPDGDELGSESETDDGDVEFLAHVWDGK